MKVLMVIPSFAPVVGGAERQLEGLAPELVSLGCKVTVVTRYVGVGPKREFRDGYQVVRLTTGGGKLGFHVALAVFLLRRRCDYRIIHCHTASGVALICALVGIVAGCPVLIKVTRSGPGSQIRAWKKSAARRLSFRLIRASGVRFLFVSGDTLAELQALGVPTQQTCYLPNGTAVFPRPTRDAALPLTVVYTGRLIARKQVHVLLRAFASTIHARTNARLVVIGDGPELPRLQKLAGQLGIQSCIEFAGELSKVAVLDRLRRAHIFVLPSTSEGMSNSLLEAMAASLAVIVSDIPANRELIDSDQSGLLFDSEAIMSQSLDRLICDTELRDRLSSGAYQRVAAHHSFGVVADHCYNIYLSILARYKDRCSAASRKVDSGL
jgi:glycosyltransferase involved in cell wall biosynthesis